MPWWRLKTGFIPVFFILAGLIQAQTVPVMGLWVTRGNLKSEYRLQQLFNLIDRTDVTDLFVQIRGRGEVFYNSDLEPKDPDITPADFDPLQYVIQEAHRRGLKVHAWMNVYFVWSRKQLPGASDHVILKHRQWLDRSATGEEPFSFFEGNRRSFPEGLYLSPTNPEVNEYLLKLVEELVTRYAIDGLHFDYIRYQDRRWGYSRAGRKRFLLRYHVDPLTLETSNGSYWYRLRPSQRRQFHALWDAFRRDAISDFVRRTHYLLQDVAPKVALSAAVKPDPKQARERYFQDWTHWVREGWLQFAVPMNYAKNDADFRRNLYLIQAENLELSRIYMGVATYNQSVQQAIAKVRQSRQAGFSNIVFFTYETFLEKPRYLTLLRR